MNFDAATHTYRHDGRIVPSVTQILEGVGLIDTTWYTEESRVRGGYVAEAIALSNRGVLCAESLDERIEPYVDQWDLFLKGNRVEVLESERTIFDRARWYAGRLDAIVQFLGDPSVTLLDVKTGAAEPWHSLQTAGYQSAIGEHAKRGCLYLQPDRYAWRTHDDRNDRHVFYAACAVHNWKVNNGKGTNAERTACTAG